MPGPVATIPLSPARAVQQARIVALAILAGQGIFLAVTAVLLASRDGVAGDPARTLMAVAIFLFAVLVPIAFLLRRRLLAPAGGGAPSPDLYLKGQIVFFALCEMPTLMFLVVAWVQETLVPGAPLALLSIAVQALNLPRAGDLPGA